MSCTSAGVLDRFVNLHEWAQVQLTGIWFLARPHVLSAARVRWSLPEGEFTLVQDEFDIQDRMDITLWIQPVGTPIEKTVSL